MGEGAGFTAFINGTEFAHHKTGWSEPVEYFSSVTAQSECLYFPVDNEIPPCNGTHITLAFSDMNGPNSFSWQLMDSKGMEV